MNKTQTPFADVEKSARGHLGLLFYEAVYHFICHMRSRAIAADKSLENVFEDFPFLATYFAELRSRLPEDITWEDSFAWLREKSERWIGATETWLPLRALREEARLSREALLAFVLVGLVEEESRFATVFAALQQPLGHRRPSLGLLHEIIQPADGQIQSDAWDVCRPLLESALVEVMNRDAPRSEWLLRIPAPLWSAVRGEHCSRPIPGTHYHAPESFTPVEELVLPETQLNRLRELPLLLAEGRTRTLVVRGLAGTERLEVVGGVARGLGLGLLEVGSSLNPRDERWQILAPLCTLTHAMPVFILELAPGETFELPNLKGYCGPIGVVMGCEGGLAGPGVEYSISVNLEAATAEYRLRHWQRALNGQPAEDLSQIAERFFLSGRYIRKAAQLASAYAALDRRQIITANDVRQGTRAINRQLLDTLATRLDGAGGWSQLVVREDTEADLRELERRCRHRERLTDSIRDDFPGGLNRGVRALFEGPSGTGKTLAARVLSSELGLDLYRVDLAAVVNKYIGETEKNLSRVLSRAEDLDVILLLDEGDALMTRRTDVRTSNDRYANLETNYLLQRVETYTGILIVTTNAGHYIDNAFRRRFDVVVKFHLPEPEQRWQLWQIHLPADHTVEPVPLEEIAIRYELTGGQIRNTAVNATLESLARGSAMGVHDLETAIHVEYRKAGASCPENGPGRVDNTDDYLAAFLDTIS